MDNIFTHDSKHVYRPSPSSTVDLSGWLCPGRQLEGAAGQVSVPLPIKTDGSIILSGWGNTTLLRLKLIFTCSDLGSIFWVTESALSRRTVLLTDGGGS